ncbi:hypothetical protein GC088_14600 [Arthrobacter sp. JZ12]|uniref:hypothetical protein n=1 Tax=Arthrobacter sp. JZ12 TaxID=2654190 RepID=UPI002B49B5C6|nr:hypothetical protein [Arthrobacter sp. JZ12]WRH26176.1 hypothetical protein GC088_14600 [Arthrobacter sp. JZ12]
MSERETKGGARRRGEPHRKPYYKRSAEQEKAQRRQAAAEGSGPILKRRGYYRRAVEEDAARQGLTVEEYGVYKGSSGSLVKPVNSAGGLLAICLLMSLFTLFSLVSVVMIFVTGDDVESWGELIFGLVMVSILLPWSWRYYYVERRAERLRREHGKTLIRPE